ncbi:MAG: hypothetical protein ACRDBX_01965 [Erysipelotrichaceae bacterium]
MKIMINPQLHQFFNRCQTNLNNNRYNSFLGRVVTIENEAKVQKAMAKAGFPDFAGDPASWPSLFLSTEQFKQTPYHTHIKLDTINSNGFSFSQEWLPANQLFNVEAIHPDPNRELKDYMTLRALDEPYLASILSQDGEVWMIDVPSEANTIDPYAAKAHGDVVTFGLGIGYFIYMAMQNPSVTSITVVERSPEVIKMFQEHLLPQFPTHIPLYFEQGDAFDYFNDAYLSRFDYAFVDIWRSNEDGFERIEALLEQHLPAFEDVDFWIESSCMELVSGMIFIYFYHLAKHIPYSSPDPQLRKLYQKIQHYFGNIRQTIEEVEPLKEWMYDPQTIREILSICLDS